ncbi:MAG: hypothetical protein EBX65_03315, partial [Betaproteobacteria bacterium]|nr:hypothetical protein [Betaproteobacteria bacterium]
VADEDHFAVDLVGSVDAHPLGAVGRGGRVVAGRARRQGQLSDDAIEAKVIERGLAKQARDFARADFLRAELAEAGIVLEDGPQGTRWRRQ